MELLFGKSTHGSIAPRPELRAAWLTGAALLLTLLVAAGALSVLPGRILDHPVLLPLGSIAVVAGAATAVLRPRWIFYGFLLGCMVIPFTFEEVSLPLGFMKLYIQDVVFAYCAFLIAVRSSVGRTTWQPIWFNKLVILHFLLGVWALFVGLKITGNAFDYTLGDFRRAFFYFMNYFVILLLTDNFRDTKTIRNLLTAGGVLILGKGALQVLTGQFYYRRFGDAAHVLSHYELTFLSFAVFLAIGKLLLDRSSSRWFWSALAGAGILMTIIGNYRAAWLSLIGGLFLIFCFVPRRGKLALIGLSLAGMFFLSLVLAVLWDVKVAGYSTLGEDIMSKAHIGNTTTDVNVTWRFESYRNAFGLWQQSPWIGRGLGEELEFSAPTSTGGAMLSTGHRVHNSFLWLLMSLGVTGFLVFAAIQAAYFSSLIRYIRRSDWVDGRVTVLACAAFYVSFMISTSFEIFLESAMPITVLSATMALAMLYIHYTPRPESEPR